MWEGKSIIHVDPGKTERHTRINFPSCHDVYELENHDISTHYPYKNVSQIQKSSPYLPDKGMF